MTTIAERIERRLLELGLPTAVEEIDDTIVLTGMVTTDEEHQAVIDIAAEEAPDFKIEDNIETEGVLAEEVGPMQISGLATEPGEMSAAGVADEDLMPGDFQNQRLLKYPEAASGPSDNIEDDLVGEGEVSYVPPTDPVRGPDNEVLGGFQITSMDHSSVARSSDGGLGDEAIAEAVRRELAEDAATTALEIDVTVMDGVVTLRGRVPDIEDVENAEEVASRVPGVVEVRDELEVDSL
jgi:hypothetical protein